MTKRNILISLITLTTMVGGVFFVSPVFAASCGGAQTSIIDCKGENGEELTGQAAILGVVKIIIQIMTAGIGILAVGATIFGAILYTSAGGNPENIKKATSIWTNTVLGLILFAFLVAITNFLIPGGVF